MGSRGGWSNTLTTENLMKDPGPRDSLSESLQKGVGLAHRHFPAANGVDQRNIYRGGQLPARRAAIKK